MDESLRYLLRETAAAARDLRNSRGWSVPQLARRAGVKQELVKSVESGADPKLRLIDIDRVAKALGVGAADLLTGMDHHAGPSEGQAERDATQVRSLDVVRSRSGE